MKMKITNYFQIMACCDIKGDLCLIVESNSFASNFARPPNLVHPPTNQFKKRASCVWSIDMQPIPPYSMVRSDESQKSSKLWMNSPLL
jgi:hypothetical protein